ncbi:MAG: M90 family metallopeptidase [Gemmatimonadaceae bacterium]
MSLWEIITRNGQRALEYAAHRLQLRLPTDPVPDEWHTILRRNVPLARPLSAPDRDRLLQVARLLLQEVPFEGCDGLVLNDEMSVTIAATASLLLYRLPYPRFTKLIRVLIYPHTFVPRKAESGRDAMVVDSDPSLGQARIDGIVILSWEAIRKDAADSTARGNVVLHEMAHILDAEDGVFDGTPIFDDPSQGPEWARVLSRDFDRQRTAVNSDENPPLDEYAARNTAEFFAVATEAFYCSPERLRTQLPDLYEQLRRLFRYDPNEPAEQSSRSDSV